MTNPEKWEAIKAEAERRGIDPYEFFLEYLRRDPRQFKKAKQRNQNQ